MNKSEATTLITALLDYFPNHRMNDANWTAWERALLPFDYSRLALNEVLQFAERWEQGFPPPLGTLKSIVRQANEKEVVRKQLPEPPRTAEEKSVSKREMAKVWQILGGKEKSFDIEGGRPTGPLEWDRRQCPNPLCLSRHTPEDCPRRREG